MIEYGALGALMSGSGPSVLDYIETKKKLKLLAQSLSFIVKQRMFLSLQYLIGRDKNGQK